MNKYFVTKKNVYQITQREDGYVVFTPECENAGMMIFQRGGIENFLAACVDDERDYDEFVSDKLTLRKAEEEARKAEGARQARPTDRQPGSIREAGRQPISGEKL